MKFIEEIVVDDFLPTFRSMLANALQERGRTQSEVASLLGISQSAVSKYVHGEVEQHQRLQQDRRIQELVEELADGLTNGETTPVEALIEAEVCIRELERGGILADLHAEAVPELSEYDSIALYDPDSRIREASRVRSSVRRGVGILQKTGSFPQRIPNVGSNLVECLEAAETVEDVAAIPGRILDVNGEVMIPGEPEFGVSQHVSSVLLAARRHGSDARAAINVSYDDSLKEALVEAGYEAAEFDAESNIDEAIDDALNRHPDATVLYQTGGFGVEPILYVFASDAPTVARVLRESDPAK